MRHISHKMSFSELLKFSLPSILMMVFLSSYTIIDGFFVSYFIGSDALSAINISYPLSGLLLAIGIMLSTGGSALVGKLMGEHRREDANKCFSLILYFTLSLSIFIAILMIIFIKPILGFLGTDDITYGFAKGYTIIILLFTPASTLQLQFQSYFVADSKPKLGLGLTIAGGLLNVILDYLFLGPLKMGINGAALASIAGFLIPAVGGLIHFIGNKNGLRLVKPCINWSWLFKSIINGSSEMVNNLSFSITTFLFNIFMIKLIGNNGVAAITVILYAQFLMNSIFLGYSLGVAPVFSYHFGACNKDYIRHIRNKSYIFIAIVSIAIMLASGLSADLTAKLFANGNEQIRKLIKIGTYLFSINYLFAGFNIFNSSLFTALNDGKTSAIISFMRTFGFLVLGIFILAWLFKENGLFLSVPFAEITTIIITMLFYHHQYHKLELIMDSSTPIIDTEA